jgi:hypothetical protein
MAEEIGVVDTAEHSHRMLKGSKKKNTVSPGLRIRNGRAPLKKRAAGVTRPVQTKGRQKTKEEWKLAIYEACLAPLNEEDRTKFYSSSLTFRMTNWSALPPLSVG